VGGRGADRGRSLSRGSGRGGRGDLRGRGSASKTSSRSLPGALESVSGNSSQSFLLSKYVDLHAVAIDRIAESICATLTFLVCISHILFN
jgi:hypothetical protein